MTSPSPQKTEIPRVTIRPLRSWHFLFSMGIIGCLLISLLSWIMYEAGKRSESAFNDVTEENHSYSFDPGICRQTKKRQLCSQIGDLTQQLQIGNTANHDLAEQVKSLSQENDHLKEKLAFFQHFVSSNTKNGISIYQFSLKETETSGKYRYALTLIQSGERPSDFKGNLKFQVKLSQNGQNKLIPLVNKNSNRNFPIEFKFLHRLEETFVVPPDANVENMQVQIFKESNNKAILTETVSPAL
ncbi:DUF6776 family protein [Nitrosomonas sp.]|uniref:DUF6776 family protein n=1 Tax=Nitrosomonas sp. TaxID=42353 RepID=UPI001D2A982A|nr:DUF6776 family protein [Nitrosomonas sp.]MBX3617640.1 hypothetical protein [Nitrosomonas sp.]